MITIHMIQEPYPDGGVGNNLFCLVVESCVRCTCNLGPSFAASDAGQKVGKTCVGIRGGNAVTTRPTQFQTYAVTTVLNNVLKCAPTFCCEYERAMRRRWQKNTAGR
jgi:hypothetical protein